MQEELLHFKSILFNQFEGITEIDIIHVDFFGQLVQEIEECDQERQVGGQPSALQQSSNDERLPHFLDGNFGSNRPIFNSVSDFSCRSGGVQRPNCSHNMRDVTAFVSPLSNHRCLTAPRTPREIIPSGHHSLSFPLHLAKNIVIF